jgi:hypothetical protein
VPAFKAAKALSIPTAKMAREDSRRRPVGEGLIMERALV